MSKIVQIELVLLKVGMYLEIVVELFMQSLDIVIGRVGFARAIVHFLSIEYKFVLYIQERQ
jgi:hypothetical protein